jgi:hypothetical protein
MRTLYSIQLIFVCGGIYLIQVKVWLGENADHCYVLSRFLLSRMLTVTKVSNYLLFFLEIVFDDEILC